MEKIRGFMFCVTRRAAKIHFKRKNTPWQINNFKLRITIIINWIHLVHGQAQL
jgi:hypothetical protein